MSKDRNQPHVAKEDTGGSGDRTGTNACPVIVVDIGASAAGLTSLQQLFAKMPPGHRVAFVLIQHLDESHENQTVKLLRDQTALAVVEAADGMPVLPDRIHVMPPGKFLNISGSSLTLHEPVSCHGLWLPIDHFFCSLAADQRRRACGILLSGTGSDGTLGLSEIKAAGGRVFVEDPESAGVPEMPQAAIDEDVADAGLPAEAMAEAIIAMAEQVVPDTRRDPEESPELDASLRDILDILYAKVGHDFRCYKASTLVRRIRRRMTLAKIATFGGYAQFLRERPEEVGLLRKDCLIGVTEFFRQPQAWENLDEKVIAALVEDAQSGSEIRVWVPGCSTGQEVYSLAMLLAGQVEQSGKKVGIQIFATDSDTASLAIARSGSYSEEEIGKNVSPERRQRFFTFRDGRYQVIKEIRRGVVFAPQNLAADPPFSRLDLISCRNLLIYLDHQAQQKIMALFHFALREGGFLFLGTAETVGERADLFEPISKKWRIYRRIGVGRRVSVEIPVRPTGEPPAAGVDGLTRGAEKLPVETSYAQPARPASSRTSLVSTAQALLLARFAPACVMINRKLEVLYVHGNVEKYLTFPAGELTTRVVDMAREGLQARLRGAISQCLEAGKSVSVTARVRRGEKSVPVKTTVSPLRYPREVDGLLLITFEDYRVSAARSVPHAAGEREVQQLQDELKVTREELQSTIEQLESSNDQLKASNEEVTAANEELQSANEELETSKEELQSLNEELNTINASLQEKVEELETTNNDVVNLLSSTNIATVFLDRDLNVKRYTPAMTHLLSLIPSDLGRPMADILRRFSDDALLDDAARVLTDLTPLPKEVQAEDGRWYIRRITPYRTHDDRISGVVVTFVDVSELERAEEALRETADKLRIVADFTYDWEYWRGADESFVYVSPSCKRVTGYPREEFMEDPALYSRIIHPEDRERVATHLREDQCHRQPCELEFRIVRRDGQERWIAHACQAVLDAHGQSLGRRGSNRDITERKQAEEEVARVASFPLLNPQPVVETDLNGRAWFTNPSAERLFPDLKSRGREHPWLVDWEVVANECREGCAELPGREVTVGGRWYHQAMYFVAETGRIRIYGLDVTQRKEAEEALRQLNADLEARVAEQTAEVRRTYDAVKMERQRLYDVLETLPAYVVLLTPDYHVPFANRFFRERFGEPHGRHCFEFLFGRTEPCEICETYTVLKTNAPHRWQWTGPDGRNYDIYDFPFTDTDGSPLIMEMGIDITELKQAEKSLKEANETLERRVAERTSELAAARNEAVSEKNRLEAIMDALPVGVAITDARGGNIHANEAFEKIWGGPRPAAESVADYAPYKAWWADTGKVVAPEEWASALAVQWDESVIGQMMQIERFDGTRAFVINSASPVRDADGNITGSAVAIQDITELRKAQEALHESEAMLLAVLEQMPSGVTVRDARSGALILSNARSRQIMGALVGTPDQFAKYRGLHPDGRPYRTEDWPVSRSMATGEVVDAEEIECERNDGTRMTLSISSAPVRDSQGRIVIGVGVFHDVTDRKRAEQALQTTLQRFHTLVSNMHSGILFVGEGGIELANQAFCDYFGLQDAPADLIGLTPPTVIEKIKNAYLHPEEEVTRIREIVGRGQVVLGEEIAMQGGRTCLRDFIPIRVDGKLHARLWCHTDITGRKQAVAALRQSREDLDRAQQVAQIGWWRLDTRRNVLTWSDENHRIFGLPQGPPLTYETFLGIVHPDDRQYVDTQWNAGLRGEPYDIEHRIVVGGQVKWVREKAYLEFDDTGSLLGGFGISQDITKRKQAEEARRASEEALRRANEQLEERVRERTAELAALNESLMERRDQLRSLASDLVLTEAREKRALASELHDTVAQMLAIAKLTLEATGARLEGKSAEEVKRVVQLLQEASRQTRSLMADLSPSLLYEAGLGQALSALARRMGELHALAIEVVDDGSPKPLGEDYRVLLFRAVQELLHNTVKHAKATTVKVSLQRDGTQMRIEVEDDGVGFLVSHRSRRDGMREGFGLFSIRERLGHLGGSFEIFSQPGRGVRAVLVVPLQVEGQGEGRGPAAVRILIAEDHRMMRDAVAALLEKEPGFKVVGLAEDGLEAVHLAREVKPDVVLMDINMPRMDGIEATRRITAELPEIKVIGFSVQTEQHVVSEMLAVGASSFVLKSSSPEELTEAIRTAVRVGAGTPGNEDTAAAGGSQDPEGTLPL